MVIYAQGREVTDTSLGSLQTCLELMADTWLHPLPFASSCSCRPCICAWPSAVFANPLSHCTATCARQGPTDPSPTQKKKKEEEENLISSASEIAWVQSWRISRTLKEFPDLRNLPKFGIFELCIFPEHTLWCCVLGFHSCLCKGTLSLNGSATPERKVSL